MQKLDENRLLSEQDYGGFLEVAKLYKDDTGTVFLHVSAGYGSERHNEEAWYRLSAVPAAPLSESAHELWLDPLSDQSADFAEEFEVEVQLLTEDQAPCE